MEYLFQYPIDTKLSGDEEILSDEFLFKGVRAKLLLQEELIYTKSKKLHIISEGKSFVEAQKKLYGVFHELFDLLIFFVKEKIELGFLELILKNERNNYERTMIYDIIQIPKENPFLKYYQSTFSQFLTHNIAEQDSKIIYYIRRAVEAQHIYDQYFHIFKAIESLLINEDSEFRKCPKCKVDAVCPECNNRIPFNRLNERNLKATLDKITTSRSYEFDYETMIKYRHLCAHPVDKGKIDPYKAGEIAYELVNLLDDYLGHKYDTDLMICGIGQAQGTHTGFWKTKYRTKNPSDDFAFDVLTMQDLEQNYDVEPADLDSI